MPETAGPNTFIVFCESTSRAFARCRLATPTVCGTSPSAAGVKKADAAPNTAVVTKNSHSVIWWVRSIEAVNAWTMARTPSQASITSRRGSRSATTPPTSVNRTRLRRSVARTRPSAVAERLIESTAKASASGMRASPAADAIRPSHKSRKERSAKGAKASPNLTFPHPKPYPSGLLARFLQTMVVIAGEARLLGFGRRDARSEVDRLYRRHADEVLRYAMLVLRSQPDAEDVLQATFMRALRAISRGERVQKPRNWLIKIAHNECRRALSVRSRRAEVELDDVPAEAVETGRAEELRRALDQLAPKQREALVLRELEGRSYAEIATTLDISGSAVETLRSEE